ncbi:hypothetical protein BGZ54_005056, partial [Gamsiella multidivaricata]
NCPNLTKLQLGTSNPGVIFDIVKHNVEYLSNLKVLELFCGTYPKVHIIIDFLKGEIQGAWAELNSTWSYNPLYLPFFLKGLLTRLTVTNAVIDQAEGLLPVILSLNPRLLEVELNCPCARFLEMLSLIIWARKQGREEGYIYAPLRIDFDSDGTDDDRIISAVRLSEESDVLDMSTDIELRSGSRPDQDYLPRLISEYEWSIKVLNTLRGALSDIIAQQLDKSTKEKGSKITTLMQDSYNLSSAGLECMGRVIDRSSYLQVPQFHVDNPLVDDAVESRLLYRHKEALTALKVDVTSHDSHIPWLAKTFLIRRDVRRLKNVYFRGEYRVPFPQEYIPWLAAMVSSPNNPSIHESSLSQSLANPQIPPSIEAAANASTAWGPL